VRGAYVDAHLVGAPWVEIAVELGRDLRRRRNCGGSTSGSRNPLPGRRSRNRLAVRVRDGGGVLGRMSPRGRCQPQPISLPDSAL